MRKLWFSFFISVTFHFSRTTAAPPYFRSQIQFNRAKFTLILKLSLRPLHWGPKTRARICKPFKEPKNRFPAGGPIRQPYLTYQPARLHRLAESVAWNRFLDFLNVYKFGLTGFLLSLALDRGSTQRFSKHLPATHREKKGDSHYRRKTQNHNHAKCRQPKQLICKGTLRQVFICLRPTPYTPPPPYTLYSYSNRKGEG